MSEDLQSIECSFRWDTVGRMPGKWFKAMSKMEAKLQAQCPRHKSKKGGVKLRVYLWAGISYYGKTKAVLWTASQAKKVVWRHTKHICKGTVFECDEGIVWRVVESKSVKDGEDVVSYVNHFENPDCDPPIEESEWSSYGEVRSWHRESRERLAGSFSCV